MRRPQRKDFRLTAARTAILERLVRYRYLRTRHFYQFADAGRTITERAVRRVLHDFWAHGYLRRQVVIAETGRGTLPQYEYAYWLAPAGVQLARERGLCGDDFAATLGDSLRTLTHDVAITDVHLSIERFSRTHNWPLYWQQHGLRRGVNPDALFALTDPGGPGEANTSYYFLELERSREAGYQDGSSALMRRLHLYAEYQASDVCRNDWEWFSEFRVVVVVATEARRRNLLARLAQELPLPMFWLAVEGSDFSAAAFRTPFDHERRAYSFLD